MPAPDPLRADRHRLGRHQWQHLYDAARTHQVASGGPQTCQNPAAARHPGSDPSPVVTPGTLYVTAVSRPVTVISGGDIGAPPVRAPPTGPPLTRPPVTPSSIIPAHPPPCPPQSLPLTRHRAHTL